MKKKDRYQELTKIWIKKAADDLLWAEDSFDAGHFGGACFVSQQMAEKSLKAYLFFKREKLIKTHNLEQLLSFCRKHQLEFKKLFPACEILNRYYTDTRYPDIWDYNRFNNKKLAGEAIKLAKKILQFVKGKI